MIFQVGEDCDIESLAWILGYKICSLLASYLGLPLGASYKSKMIWELVINRISARLNSWKAPMLSKCGRLTLVKATLAVMPNCFLSFLTILSSIASRMETLFRNFLWNDSAEKHRYHLVNWNSCCRLLKNGDLGIRRIRDHNRALLANWIWRFGRDMKVCGGRWWWLGLGSYLVGSLMRLKSDMDVVFGNQLWLWIRCFGS